MPNTYLARYSLVAFVWRFGIDSKKLPWGSRRAVDNETDSVFVRAADLLVGDCICHASTFERYRGGNVQRLYRRPFSFPASRHKFAKGDIRFCIHLSASAGFREETPDGLCSVCPPTS